MDILGLTKPAPTNEDIVGHSKILCREYIYTRLKRDSLLPPRMVSIRTNTVLSDVSNEVQRIGLELELSYGDLYRGVAKQVHVSLAKSDKSLKSTLMTIAGSLFKIGAVSWTKIVTLFAIAGGLAADCVKQKYPQYVSSIVDVVGLITAKYLLSWIARRGGWLGCLQAFQVTNESQQTTLIAGFSALLASLISFFVTTRALSALYSYG